MKLAAFFPNPWIQDLVATVITFLVILLWLRIIDAIAHRHILPSDLSRKLVHIGTGPLFVLAWNLFSDRPEARWFAVLVPFAITAQFVLIGLEILKDPATVQALSRTGNPREILRGPLFYGIVFVVMTLLFWSHSPVGIMALMLMCGGDGLADVIGRRWGQAKLPWTDKKSWAGSAAMFAGSFIFAFFFIALFNALGYFYPALDLASSAIAVGIISLVATLVEALPYRDIDNITTTLAAVVTAWLLIVPLGFWHATFLS